MNFAPGNNPSDPPRRSAPPESCVLTVNGGSSSIKFAVFRRGLGQGEPPVRWLSGQVERIGATGTTLAVAAGADGGRAERLPLDDAADHRQGAERLIGWLRDRLGASPVIAVGHRVVHGGPHLLEHQIVTGDLLAELRRTQPLDLAHLPREIALIEAFGLRFPGVPQVACFDTVFHRDLPRVARLLPIPRRYAEAGVRRFGFHGLSYAYLMGELRRVAGGAAADGRVILAHLGSGASMAAVRGGKPVDTTMAFTPTAGLVMGTRPGDLDPGLLVYLMRVERRTPDEMDEFISSQCGLIGVSDTTSDMRDLIHRRADDPRAAEAVELFCYQAKKFVGAYAAALGGVDTLVFSGGIGEHSPEVRAGICEGLRFLGIQINGARNAVNAPVISTDDAPVTMRVISTDEEIVIAEAVYRLSEPPRPHGHGA